MSKIHWNFQKFDSFYQKCQKYTGIFDRILKIWGKMIKIDSENDRKSQKLYQNV